MFLSSKSSENPLYQPETIYPESFWNIEIVDSVIGGVAGFFEFELNEE